MLSRRGSVRGYERTRIDDVDVGMKNKEKKKKLLSVVNAVVKRINAWV
jgi:hypothetical protein